jgi:phytoene dehydrogenase-like protein
VAVRGEFRYPVGADGMASVAGGLGSASGLARQLEAFGRGDCDDADPWLLIVCPSVVDPGRAPPGDSTLKLLTVAPHGRGWGRAAASATPTG